MIRYLLTASTFAFVLFLAPLPLAQGQDNHKPASCCKTDEPSPTSPVKVPSAGIASYPKDHLPPCLDPATFVTGFDKVFPGVTAIKVAGPRKVLFLFPAPPDKKTTDQIDAVVKQLESTCSPMGVTYYTYPNDRKHLGARAPLSAAVLVQLKTAIPGVKEIIPSADGRYVFVIDRAPDKGAPAGLRDIELVRQQIRQLMDLEYGRETLPCVISLPPGIKNASTIATMLNNKVRNATVAASDNARLVVTPAPADDQSSTLCAEIQPLVDQLAAPPNGYSAPVISQVTRLFYFRDGAKAAAALQSVLPDLTVTAVGNDAILLSAAIPENSINTTSQDRTRKALQQGKRITAQLDQPHAQVSLYAWSLQLSDKEQTKAKACPKNVKDDRENRLQIINSIGALFNELVSSSVGAGWGYLRGLVQSKPGNFDPIFAGYLRGRVRVTPGVTQGRGDFSTNVTYCCASEPNVPPPSLKYGLGFDNLFSDLSPNLMNMLLVVSATSNPADTANCLIDRIEGTTAAPSGTCYGKPKAVQDKTKWHNACQASDQDGYVPDAEGHEHFQMECTRDLLNSLFRAKDGETNPGLGRFRATVADFLFQYKTMTEYPDEFDPYLEPYSASKLDAQLVEFVDAFESDLAVLNFTLRDRVAEALKTASKEGESYDYSGIVSIKVVAGQEALVESKAQNYFPATPPSTLADFAKALSTAESSEPAILTGNLPANAATLALAGLAQLTPPKQTVSIGRELDMTVTPYTLSAANGAELDIDITAKDNGASVVAANSTGGGTPPDDLASRIAAHHVKSHVRLQSLKLFELSSLDSTLARSKEPWKPFDPYLELPIVGDLVRRPRHPDVIRQRGVVFISAVVVPTAADLAATPIEEDFFAANPPARFGHTVHSLLGVSQDLPETVMRYHASMLRCLAATTTTSDGTASGCTQQKLDSFFEQEK